MSFFAPDDGHLRPGIATPQQLLCPGYPKKQTPDLSSTKKHRTYQTHLPAVRRAEAEDRLPLPGGRRNKRWAEQLAAVTTGITLVSWEHTAIPTLGKAIAPKANIPASWPDPRFDVVWSFAYNGSDYDFNADRAECCPPATPRTRSPSERDGTGRLPEGG